MRLKKVMATGLVAALALSTMVGCSSKKDSSDQKKIGVVQLVEHDALDASYKGFKDGLEKAGYKDGDKIKIEYSNMILVETLTSGHVETYNAGAVITVA